MKTLNYPYLTTNELEFLLNRPTPNSCYSKIKRLIAQNKLLPIRRGLYCVTEELGCTIKPHPFELAQRIYYPSYVSLESALSFHQLIPEAVYTTTSVSTKRSKEFNTPIGVFSYLRIPLENFYLQVELIKENNYQFFMAMPWKAICDYIFCYKKNWTKLTPLVESLRLNLDKLPVLRREEIELLNEYYHHSRINRFLKGIQKERRL